jgi:predicted acyltransferase
MFLSLVPGKIGVLLFSVSFMLVCWVLGYCLDRKNIIIKI